MLTKEEMRASTYVCSRRFAAGNAASDMTKERLKRHLNVVSSVLYGAGSVLPFWKHDPIQLLQSVTDTTPMGLRHTVGDEATEIHLTPCDSTTSKNVRVAVIECMHGVQQRLLADKQDDTKSLSTVVHILHSALTFGGITREEYDARSKRYNAARRSLDDRVIGSRKQLRAIIIDRALLQHESRIVDRCNVAFTEIHK